MYVWLIGSMLGGLVVCLVDWFHVRWIGCMLVGSWFGKLVLGLGKIGCLFGNCFCFGLIGFIG